MTGDKLKELETGFLEGSLSDEEEVALRQWVRQHPEHPLAPYFQWTSDADELEIPNFQSKVKLEKSRRKTPWLKVAAAILVLCVAGFLFRDRMLPKPTESFSQAEIDESYEATMETLSAMAGFLDKSLSDTKQAIDLSKPFEKLNDLKDENSK